MRLTQACSFFVVWLSLIGFLSSQASAIEIADLQFTKLSNEDGLSSTTVLDIVEDHNGYIWLATMNGLNRYSGYEVKQYHPSDTNPNSLPSGFIYKILVHSNGDLWFATHSGLAKYRPSQDDFETFNSANSAIKVDAITAVSEASNGDVLFADNKYLYTYSLEDGSVTQRQQVFPSHSFVKHIFDESSRTWLGSKTSGGMIVDKVQQQAFPLNEVNPWNILLPTSSFHDILIIEGNYWAATSDGVFVYSATGNSLAHLDMTYLNADTPVDVFSLANINGQIWLGTNKGLYIVTDSIDAPTEIERDHILHVSGAKGAPSQLSQNVFTSIIKDRNDAVWLGSIQGALKHHEDFSMVRYYPSNTTNEDKSNFATIWGLSQDAKGTVYFAAQREGVGIFDKSNGSMELLAQDPAISTDTTFWDLVIDKNGHFWVATSDGLLVYKRSGNKLSQINHLFKGEFID